MTNTPVEGPGAPPAYLEPGQRQRQHPTGAVVHDSLMYASLNGYRNLELDLSVPAGASGPVPVVVWIHGGAWLLGTRLSPPESWGDGSPFQQLVDAGIAVASIDYRHSREAPFPAQLHDAKAAIRYLRKFSAQLGLDPERIGVWGESAGGHLAALVGLVSDPELEGEDGVLGTSSAVSAVVDFYGIANTSTMPDFLSSADPSWVAELQRVSRGRRPEPLEVLVHDSPYEREEALRLLSPIQHVSAAAPPFLLVHGELDSAVPITQSEELAAVLREAGVDTEFIRVAGAEHVFIGTDPAPQLTRAVAFLVEKLATR
jgi:acetyl esterase/lipase